MDELLSIGDFSDRCGLSAKMLRSYAAAGLLVPAAVDAWLADVDAVSGGAIDPALPRLGLAVIRGLLLDLVATDDDAGVDAAAQAFVDLVRRAGLPQHN